MLRYFVLVAAAAAVSLPLTTGAAPQDPKKPAVDDPMALQKPLHFPSRKEAMAMKLKQSQAILEGIALNDFDRIRTAAEVLILICEYNEFLNAFKGDEYRFQLRTFRRTIEAMAMKAKDKSMDGVALAFHDMTNQCLKCHQTMRDKKFDIGTGPSNILSEDGGR